MIRRFTPLVALLATSLAHGEAPTDSEAARAALQAKLAALPQFEAQFTQTVTDFDGTLLQEGEGQLAVAVPQRFSWHQMVPEESLILSDGEAVYVYDPMLEQVSIYALMEATGQTPLSLLASDDDAAWAQYQVSQSAQCYELTPLEAQEIARMTVCFEGERIDTLSLTDSQSVTTTMALAQFSAAPLAADRFQFTPPQGTLVDDQRTP
ncbi:outer membrane lipoprotein chaperone LolA [Ferrimonas balearica]|uniref:outer membrane lipoprotein chaperone LolA n=1 Tax=Ferrimonas balearica TaxID=44012 RepID=UPI001C995AE4|nr:outer membrane lipoprotein chaperone LolA [Ferrimonas balearica]MBY5991677.1 outer membrane lipoprotein chaperone LolA [Ferrimonas balearica]